ncbi:uncharacterized protein LOC133892071 [Phragmites australis]|uniref:uncharacterized protein LOC133892071 n=1 Tax=Phragmites australis TaxID=29695 RepID=UPI002D764CAF|nr:uncharacterized protein LOC133892071 [Phragmites australis]
MHVQLFCYIRTAEDSEHASSSHTHSTVTVHSSSLVSTLCSIPMHEMGGQRLLLLLALLLTLVATAVIGEGDVVAAGSAGGANATDAEPPSGRLDVRARKRWRFPATEGIVRGSERRVPNSSDPLHNR